MTTYPFRFGVNLRGTAVEEILDQARRAEREGLDLLYAADHLRGPSPSPWPALAVAATATTRMRLGTLVLNNEFANPALLARDAATLDRLSAGRLELGLGAGHMKWEFDTAGIPWHAHARRVARLEESIAALRRHLTDPDHTPEVVQRPHPPLLVGAHGRRTLELAARHADIVGFGGLSQVPGAAPGTFRLAGPEETRDRVDLVARHAGERTTAQRYNVLVQHVEITDDAERSATALAARYGENGLPTARAVMESPYILVGTEAEIAEEVVALRRSYGFSDIAAHGTSMDALTRVAPAVRSLAGEEHPRSATKSDI